MSFKLMYITNDEMLALEAEKAGVDWIFVDLEINGKEERQGHLDTVISKHSIEDVKKIKKVLTYSKLLVRVNPIFSGSEEEIERVINDGADIVMLPYFKNDKEVERFTKIVDGRTETCLLLETKEAVENLHEILLIEGIDYIHIGLNDLHLSYNLSFMFELFSNGVVESIVSEIQKKDIPYGIGGIASLGKGDLSSNYILAEHIRLGSNMAILSRSFDFKDEHGKPNLNKFRKEIKKIQDYIDFLKSQDASFFQKNKNVMDVRIEEIVIKKGD